MNKCYLNPMQNMRPKCRGKGADIGVNNTRAGVVVVIIVVWKAMKKKPCIVEEL